MTAEEWPSIVSDENSETGLVEYRYIPKKLRCYDGSVRLEWSPLKPFQTNVLQSALTSPTGGRGKDRQPPVGLNLSFHDLSYSVKVGIRRDMVPGIKIGMLLLEKKQILQDVSGEFHAGELTAIMGPSGAGKSTLMNALAGYITVGVAGSIRINGVEREMRTFCKSSCYIHQDDILPPKLTVSEAMAEAAKLKLGPNHPNIEERIGKILEALGLQPFCRVFTCNLSGGQRKRLAIALELVSNPPIMFFDEPTSGLDSSTSKQCLSLLKEMSQEGKTIICTIHQPSASLFELFDHVYVIASGKCIYSGASTSLIHFLVEQQLTCPEYHNPADFILEVASMEEYGSNIPKLVNAITQGKCNDWRKNKLNSNAPSFKNEDVPSQSVSTASNFLHIKKSDDQVYCTHLMFAASFWTQFTTLTLRNFRKLYRNQFTTHLRIGIHLIVALLIGVMFYDIGNQASRMRENFGLIFFSIMFVMFTAYSSAVMYYPLEIPILEREHFNKWYHLKSFYLAANFSEVPVQLLCTTLYYSITYFLTSQPMEVARYLISAGTLHLVSFLGQSFGYLIGSSMSITNAAIFGPFAIAPFILFSGFFVIVTDAPDTFQWLFHISYFKYALHAILHSTYGFDRERLPCTVNYCHYRIPEKFLKEIGMSGGDFLYDWLFLIGVMLFLRVLAYYALVIQIRFLKK